MVGMVSGYIIFQAPNQSATTNTQTELEKYQIAEQLATQHIKTFDNLDFSDHDFSDHFF
ncbi:hypothetical protein BG20_I2051 [Candidatus Nitrosarchaeum limnium BG20]|uniref:Uncharacterized protein n=1 Tax=Candidatus Nitrosarchaeum limnium BG20 TaxID=859192 RepID=S2E694_9ARCH|nr:hypothetical protein BG20_I2051 [Candidatus Nitrosarchaeum limnium BG20]